MGIVKDCMDFRLERRSGSRVRWRRRERGRRGLEQDAEGRGKNEKKYEDDGDGQR